MITFKMFRKKGFGVTFFTTLAAELIVVFIGVYGANMLSERHAAQEDKARQIQIYSALIQELNVFADTGALMSNRFTSYVEGWDSQYANGDKPRPPVFALTGVDTPPRAMWDATVAADGLRYLPVETLYQASSFYHALDAMIEKYQEVVSFSNESIIPFNNSPQKPFYEGSVLAPEYEAYTQRFKDVVRLLSYLNDQAVLVRDQMQIELNAL